MRVVSLRGLSTDDKPVRGVTVLVPAKVGRGAPARWFVCASARCRWRRLTRGRVTSKLSGAGMLFDDPRRGRSVARGRAASTSVASQARSRRPFASTFVSRARGRGRSRGRSTQGVRLSAASAGKVGLAVPAASADAGRFLSVRNGGSVGGQARSSADKFTVCG